MALPGDIYQGVDMFGSARDLDLEKLGPLAEKFGISPFNVHDTKVGAWLRLKRAWIATGIRSEAGRASDTADAGVNVASVPGGKTSATLEIVKLTEKLTAMGYPPGTQPPQGDPMVVWGELKRLKALEADEETDAPDTSVFDPVLCEVGYRWFCPKGGHILDPFAGGSVRGLVAAWLGYQYTGIELREGQVDANRQQFAVVKANHDKWYAAEIAAGTRQPMQEPNWIVGDSTDIDELLPIGEEYDMIFSCPPYFDLETYSAKKGDGSRMTYPEFLVWYELVYRQCVDRLRNNRFAMITVGDVRVKSASAYRGLPEDTFFVFARKLGMHKYNHAILYTAIGSLPLRTSAQFPKNRKYGSAFQTVYTFWKGADETNAVKQALGALSTDEFAVTQK